MITVLRIGHRPQRDKRITTHVALVARAFGAGKIIIDRRDKNIEENILGVNERFGGDFQIQSGKNWRNTIKNFKGTKVHLTMYGLPLDESIKKIQNEEVLVIIGAEKVPREVYELSDFNIAVGNQPHSEVAALSIFLDRLFNGKELKKEFSGRFKINPCKKGKDVKSYPSEKECLSILENENMDKKTIEHSKSVMKLAVEIAKNCNANISLIKAGALLHDLGRSKDHSLKHVMEGVKIAQKYKLSLEIVHIIEKHIGAGISKQEAVKFGLEYKDYIPQTLEEKIVAHADNLIINNKKVSLDICLKKFDKNISKKIKDLHHEIENICNLNLDDIVI